MNTSAGHRRIGIYTNLINVDTNNGSPHMAAKIPKTKLNQLHLYPCHCIFITSVLISKSSTLNILS